MDEQTIRLLQESFAEVMAIRQEAAALFYERLFAIDPALRPLFSDADMRSQEMKLMAALALVVGKLRQLVIQNPQGMWQARALAVSNTLAQIQLSIQSQPSDSMSKPFVFLLVLWLCFIFATFAMSSAPNATLLCVLFFCALSAASAIYLILELGQPFDGLMQVPSAPLRNALPPL